MRDHEKDIMHDGRVLPMYKPGTHISSCMLPTLPLRHPETLSCPDLPALTPIPNLNMFCPIVVLRVLSYLDRTLVACFQRYWSASVSVV